MKRGTELYELMEKGEFIPLMTRRSSAEIRVFIENLEGIQSTLVSDHILNLLEELEGKFPEEKSRLLSIIDRYFSLSEEERMIFRLGRRKGLYRRLDDLSNPGLYSRLKIIVEQYATGASQDGP